MVLKTHKLNEGRRGWARAFAGPWEGASPSRVWGQTCARKGAAGAFCSAAERTGSSQGWEAGVRMERREAFLPGRLPGYSEDGQRRI